MKRVGLFGIMIVILTCMFGNTAIVSASEDIPPQEKKLHIASVANRPLSVDRLVYAAFKEINQQITVTSTVSLQQAYEMADNHERDGVISSVPNMTEIYPHLRQVPVALEDNNVLAFARSDRNLVMNEWEDLSGLRVGMLTQRVYLLNKIPDNASVITKETTKLLLEGLAQGEYDVVILSLRSHETVSLPEGIMQVGKIETLMEYIYLHESLEYLIPEVTNVLLLLEADGRMEKILSNIPVSEMYSKKTVLYLISSNTDISREDCFGRTLKESFYNDTSVEWYSLALNSKRYSKDQNRLSYFANLLRQDCVSRDIAAIVVSGKDALDFLKDYYFLLFKNIPVLFYGIGDDYEEVIQDYEPYFSGVVESIPAYETVSAALKLFPDTKNLYVINDYTTEGQDYRASVEKQLKQLNDSINIEYNENMSRDSLLERIKTLPPDSLVFVGSYFCDYNGQYYSLNEMKRVLEADCPVPVASVYSTEVVYHSVGGKCLDYEICAGIIADMLVQLLDGADIGSIPIVTDSSGYSRWIFDKNLMNRWGIRESDLPQGAEIINERLPIWESNPEFAVSMAALLVISIVIIIITQFYRQRLKRIAVAAEEASRAKSVFLMNMSHEIRTPMNAIIGFTELALEDQTASKLKDYIRKIKDSSEILLHIINDILDISKIEAGKIILENIPFNMYDIFQFCRTITALKAEEKGIALYCYAEPPADRQLLGDPLRLRQVLLNLLSNAVKFTNNGMVKLMTAVEKTEEDSVTIRFEVKDSGIGMTPAQMEKIFEPFNQADESTTRKYGGTGLGLVITKNIIELMGGSLMVESVPGIGSKFSFVLTFKTVESPANISDHEISDVNFKKPVFNGMVLVCEDNMINQEVICEHLHRVGLDAVTAVNGSECVEIVKRRMESEEKPFDMIFMDIHMPVMDGIRAAVVLGEIGNRAPIIALTANMIPEDNKKYLKQGFSDLLGKPFKKQELWRCLLKYITPVDVKDTDISMEADADERLRIQLQSNFVKDNQTTYEDLKNALKAGDVELSHRIAHTLKSVAALIGRTPLQEAASAVESSLEGGKAKVVTVEQMNILEQELSEVLNELAPLLHADIRTARPERLHEEALEGLTDELIDELEILLLSNNTECMDWVDILRDIPGTDLLIEQIEAYEFKAANETLIMLKKK